MRALIDFAVLCAMAVIVIPIAAVLDLLEVRSRG